MVQTRNQWRQWINENRQSTRRNTPPSPAFSFSDIPPPFNFSPNASQQSNYSLPEMSQNSHRNYNPGSNRGHRNYKPGDHCKRHRKDDGMNKTVFVPGHFRRKQL